MRQIHILRRAPAPAVLRSLTQSRHLASHAAVQPSTGAPSAIRTDWTRDEVSAIYNTPLMDLVYQAATIHRANHNPAEVQLCTLYNIKSGGCTEDCKYCAQSSRYTTGVEAEKAVKPAEVIAAAQEAKDNGSTRFCMGAAWRDMKGRKNALKNVKEMIGAVHAMGMESCVTLGMVDKAQAEELRRAGLTAYNHNIDTSREHYPNVITTRTFDERLQTISNVRDAGVSVCSGGILGLGETADDHVGFLWALATMPAHPESLPINRLVPIKGTPLGDDPTMLTKEKQLTYETVVRTVATGRVLMPGAKIRLAAGRYTMKESEQAMCFMAGANAIFTGKKMLTTMCNGWDEDKNMLEKWGLKPMKSFERVDGHLAVDAGTQVSEATTGCAGKCKSQNSATEVNL